MKKVRAVVEVSVPDKAQFSEDDFAKLLRRELPERIYAAPRGVKTVRIRFKAFYRVVQYTPDGNRIKPKSEDHVDSRPSQFQFMVLGALWALILAVLFKADIKARDIALNYRSSALAFGDLYGVPGEDAREYRRENTYWVPLASPPSKDA